MTMTTESSTKQLRANRENAKHGGVKTQAGKDIVRFNARKHGVLSQLLTEYEEDIYGRFLTQLFDEFEPQSFMEHVLVERIAVCYMRLYRSGKAEREFVLSRLNPHVEHDLLEVPITHVSKKGYVPTIGNDAVHHLSGTYLRYETGIENRLYKAMHELERLQRMRRGEVVHAPVMVDVQSENGFVSQNQQ